MIMVVVSTEFLAPRSTTCMRLPAKPRDFGLPFRSDLVGGGATSAPLPARPSPNTAARGARGPCAHGVRASELRSRHSYNHCNQL